VLRDGEEVEVFDKLIRPAIETEPAQSFGVKNQRVTAALGYANGIRDLQPAASGGMLDA
jgi:hypothetical protein